MHQHHLDQLIALDVDVHYLEYHVHGCLTIDNYLPPVWNNQESCMAYNIIHTQE